MDITSLGQLIPVLQTSVSPIIMISGVGLILLTMTNRLGRIVDRSRVMATSLPDMQAAQQQRTRAELAILWKRARLMRLAIGAVTVSALASALLVVLLFVSAWLQLKSGWMVGSMFILSMGSLCVSLIVFIREIHFSLQAIALEINAVDDQG